MSIKMILAATAALAMAAGTPALAAKSQGQSQQAVAADAGGANAKKTCRTFRNTVSRMKQEKLCLTRADWKKFEQEQSQ
jgi:hypothetical protein